MAANALVLKTATRFRERLEALLGDRLLEVRVFGSRARGDAHEESDLDIFVLVEGDEHQHLRKVVGQACELAIELDLPFSISPLLMERGHYETLQRQEALLARDLANEGIPV